MTAPFGRWNAIVLRPPGNVEKILHDVQRGMLNRTGATSTQALPPVLPIAYVETDPGRDLVKSLPQESIEPLRLQGLLVLESSVVLTTVMQAAWGEWARQFVTVGTPAGVPGARLGFFLGSSDLAQASGDVITSCMQEQRDVLPRRLAVVQVALLQIEFHSDPWWHDVDWTIPWSLRVKLRG